jgi:23S rRNA (uracil1939-C5)-methyltransferase
MSDLRSDLTGDRDERYLPPGISGPGAGDNALSTGNSTAEQAEARVEDEDAESLIEVELTDLAYGGDAVGRNQGRAVFVSGALPGELVRARLTRERSNYARASLVEVLRASPDRITPLYPELGESGGFQWQHLAYESQLRWKTRIVRQLLLRIGRFANPEVYPTIGVPPGVDPWHYRTVAQFAIGLDGAIGFRRAASHDVIDMPTCPLVDPALEALYVHVRAWIKDQWGDLASDYAERFTLRVAFGGTPPAPDGSPPKVVRAPGEPAGLLTIEARPASALEAPEGQDPRAVAEQILAAVPELVGVLILGLPGGRGRIVAGQDHVYERVEHLTFRISAGSFFQVNTVQTPALVRAALTAAEPRNTDWVLDGYSGVGLFSLFFAEQSAHVHAIESQPSAVADARVSASLSGIANVTFTEGMLERVIGTLRRQRERADLVLVDPPRSGCNPRALTEVRALAPRTFVYISCDPSTLARDLALFCAEDYRLISVQPVDMFPFTSHIESVALCERARI